MSAWVVLPKDSTRTTTRAVLRHCYGSRVVLDPYPHADEWAEYEGEGGCCAEERVIAPLLDIDPTRPRIPTRMPPRMTLVRTGTQVDSGDRVLEQRQGSAWVFLG